VYKLRIGSLIAGLAVLLMPSLNAGTLALDTVGLGHWAPAPSGHNDVGWKFQVNTAILVDGLAFWDNTDTASHDVGIYSDSTHALLVWTTVTTGHAPVGTGPWQVQPIAPYLLQPGIYEIAAETGSDNYTYTPTSMSTIPEITFLQDRYEFGWTVLAFPSQSSGGGLVGWFGPSFTAVDAPTPEPVSSLLCGAGLLALALVVRRRRSQAR
jgi:uncharacterized protein (TIGR03382 family)